MVACGRTIHSHNSLVPPQPVGSHSATGWCPIHQLALALSQPMWSGTKSTPKLIPKMFNGVWPGLQAHYSIITSPIVQVVSNKPCCVVASVFILVDIILSQHMEICDDSQALVRHLWYQKLS